MPAFKVDENLPEDLLALLRRLKHDAHGVHQESLNGKPDETVAKACQREQRCLITLDLDFADVRRYPPREFAGLMVLRCSRQDKAHVLAIAERMLQLLDEQPLAQRLWIVDDATVRIRA